MAQLGFSYHLMPRLGFKLTSVELHQDLLKDALITKLLRSGWDRTWVTHYLGYPGAQSWPPPQVVEKPMYLSQIEHLQRVQGTQVESKKILRFEKASC